MMITTSFNIPCLWGELVLCRGVINIRCYMKVFDEVDIGSELFSVNYDTLGSQGPGGPWKPLVLKIWKVVKKRKISAGFKLTIFHLEESELQELIFEFDDGESTKHFCPVIQWIYCNKDEAQRELESIVIHEL